MIRWRSLEERALVDSWLSEGLGERTVEQYLGMVRFARRWCGAHGCELATLAPTSVTELADTLPFTWSSRRLLRSALRAFWLAGDRENPPIRAIRVPRKPQMRSRALQEPDAARLDHAARLRGDHKGLVVLLALYLGLRRAEIAALRWSDFEDDLSWVTFTGKGDLTATLPVHPVLVEALRPLRRDDSLWMFPGRFGAHVVPATVWAWVRDVAEEAKLRPIAVHVLRHTCLTTANDATRDLRAVQMFARHARPETTAGYTRVHTKRIISVMLALDYQQAAEEAS